MAKEESELEISQRAERIRTAIALLESQKAEIERNEVVAPLGCCVMLPDIKPGVRNIVIGIISLEQVPQFFPKPIKRMNILVFNI